MPNAGIEPWITRTFTCEEHIYSSSDLYRIQQFFSKQPIFQTLSEILIHLYSVYKFGVL